jgi:hypothetical protein
VQCFAQGKIRHERGKFALIGNRADQALPLSGGLTSVPARASVADARP